MLARAAFQNFKGLQDLSVDLSPITVIVGKNGAGKTSILQGIHYASQVGARRADEEKNPAGRLGALFSGARDPRRLVTLPWHDSVRLALTEVGGCTLSLTIALPPEEEEGAGYRFQVHVSEGDPAEISVPGASAIEVAAFFKSATVRGFASAIFLHLDATVMAKPSAWVKPPTAKDDVPRVEHDGEGLASLLSYLAGAEPDTLDAITRDLARVVPRVRGIRTFPATVSRRRRERIIVGEQEIWRTIEEEVPGHRFSLDFGAGRIVPADLLSEGTVLALGLLVMLRHPRCPRLVLLDDVDRALHFEAQAELVRCLREIRGIRPDVQIVCTSHSPYLLDHFELEEVRLTAMDPRGNVVCRALREHPEAERWKKMLRTGEFWASVGEGWLLDEADHG